MSKCNLGPEELGLPDSCCTAETGCSFDGSLRNVVSEPIYVQKVYDAALFNLQGLRNVRGVMFEPELGEDARIIRVLDIRCRKFFNPCDIKDPRNLTADADTDISGASFVKKGGKEITVVGPDGFESERLLYADTHECDEEGQGTPIFGSQTISITGDVLVEIDVLFVEGCGKKCKATLTATVPVGRRRGHGGPGSMDVEGQCDHGHKPLGPVELSNFFELCLPSTQNTAFLPRFTEFCNIGCQVRLATNNIGRDLEVDEEGFVTGDLIVALCVTCEKKIIVPVQLCVLSTGFPVLAADTSPVCTTFPPLFPDQIDEATRGRRGRRGCSVENDEVLGEEEEEEYKQI